MSVRRSPPEKGDPSLNPGIQAKGFNAVIVCWAASLRGHEKDICGVIFS